MVTGSRALCWIALLTAACGGVVEGGSHDPGGSAPSGAAAASGSSSSSSGADDPNADTDLGACQLGSLENLASGAPCAWVAEKRCYDTREMACNCACPRNRNSQCASGWAAGPDGHVWVACN